MKNAAIGTVHNDMNYEQKKKKKDCLTSNDASSGPTGLCTVFQRCINFNFQPLTAMLEGLRYLDFLSYVS